MEKNMINDEVMENVTGGQINHDTGKYIFYTVVRNDCLSKIAYRYGVDTKLLYIINRNVIGPNMNLIQPGMVLKVPTL